MILTESNANAVFDILKEHAGADERLREEFVYDHVHGDTIFHVSEWRFQGSLGFGGKFYTNERSWYVNCYIEDRTPEKDEAIKKTNEFLTELRLKQ